MKTLASLILLLGLCACSSPSARLPPGAAAGAASTPETRLFKGLSQEQLQALDAKTGDYRLGAGDVIEIYCMDVTELNRRYVLGPDGKMTLPGIGVVILNGLTREESERQIEALLKPAYLSPRVNLLIIEYNNNRVSVLGEVRWPGQYNFPGRPTLLDALARAQGLTDKADLRGCTVVRGNGMLIEIDLYALLRNGDRTLNIPLLPEDAVYVKADEEHNYFVLGEVARPGVFKIGLQVDVVRAVASAGGQTRDAKLGDAHIVRRLPDGSATTIRVNLDRLMRGKTTDSPPVLAGDIIYVPRKGIATFNYYLSQITPALNTILLGTTLESVTRDDK
jgi:polysaccharide export outer membrane protein